MSAQRLRGFGRATTSLCDVEAITVTQVAEALKNAPRRGLIVRGSGCSYGDAALNTGGQVLLLQPASDLINVTGGAVTAPASATFDQILRACSPHGLSLPVLPGTRHLTLGGAIAADVHGKNHVLDGTLGRWLEEIVIIDGSGARRTLRPGEPGFRATTGGMGLTGVITAATVRLQAATTRLEVTNRRCVDFDHVLNTLDRAADQHHFAVAWIDGLAGGAAAGRGVVSAADFTTAEPPELAPSYSPGRQLAAPLLPRSAVTPGTARAFNALWWWRARHESTSTQSLSAFFHPLDAVRHWNRLYGPAGFLQYQFVVPDDGVDVMRLALLHLRSSGATPFLGVLKRFGAQGEGLLSFPRPGWSLAVDLPRTVRLSATLEVLDHLVADSGGAVYLAKDARLNKELLPTMYPRLAEWRGIQRELDPAGIFRSDLDRRLGLVHRA